MRFKDLMIKTFVLLIFLSSVCFVDAQKKKTVRTIKPSTISETSEIKDFAFVLEIDKDANVTMKIQNSEDSDILANSSSTKPLTDFFSAFSRLQNTKTVNKNSNFLDPIIIIKADSMLNFGEIVKVIQASRISFTQKIKLEISKNLYALIPRKTDEKETNIKPNPLTLVVSLKKDSKILLNRYEMGDFPDTIKLRGDLKQIFKDRDANGNFREGTNELERTVFIKVPLSLKFRDVIKLAQDIAETGASPIGLQIDELE